MKSMTTRISISLLICMAIYIGNPVVTRAAAPTKNVNLVSPLPVPTSEVNNPAFQPFQAVGSANFGTGVTAGVGFVLTDPVVPAGKRLVVTYASFGIDIDIDLTVGKDGTGFCTVSVGQPNDEGPPTLIMVHRLPVSVLDPRHGDGFRRIIGSGPLTLYADAGNEVAIRCITEVDSEAGGFVGGGISGYFIDLN